MNGNKNRKEGRPKGPRRGGQRAPGGEAKGPQEGRPKGPRRGAKMA